MTYRDAIVENWIASGVDPDLLRLNPEAIDREVEKELQLWINSFISSFRPENRLKAILERSFFMRTPALFSAPKGERSIAGLTVKIRADNEKDFRFLVSRRKQLSYRLQKIDPAAKFLSLYEPQGIEALTTILSSGETLLSRTGKGGER
ncbi:MAG: hypothetical protein M3O33_04430 [Cyanobacteriota bacterium]|nr:hypothetical protein [Cyanobacteriota bacterium]